MADSSLAQWDVIKTFLDTLKDHPDLSIESVINNHCEHCLQYNELSIPFAELVSSTLKDLCLSKSVNKTGTHIPRRNQSVIPNEPLVEPLSFDEDTVALCGNSTDSDSFAISNICLSTLLVGFSDCVKCDGRFC